VILKYDIRLFCCLKSQIRNEQFINRVLFDKVMIFMKFLDFFFMFFLTWSFFYFEYHRP